MALSFCSHLFPTRPRPSVGDAWLLAVLAIGEFAKVVHLGAISYGFNVLLTAITSMHEHACRRTDRWARIRLVVAVFKKPCHHGVAGGVIILAISFEPMDLRDVAIAT